MKVKIKKLVKEAVIPNYAKSGDAGMDLVATSKSYDDNGNVVYGVGLAFEIPEGFVGLLFPRSSNAKQDLLLSNSVGVLDSGYRGEVMFKFKSTYSQANERGSSEYEDSDRNIEVLPSYKKITKFISIDENFEPREEIGFINEIPNEYEVNDRIGQIIILPYPKIEFQEVEELSDSERGAGGYGSTGK